MADAAVMTRDAANGSVVVELRGVISDAAIVELARAIVEAVRHRSPARLLLDMRAVELLDALGIGTVIAGSEVAADAGIDLMVIDAAPTLARRLRTAGIRCAPRGR
jgi:anti-anti-sigma factor